MQFLPRLSDVLGIKTLNLPPGYLSNFDIADEMFQHEMVFDPVKQKAVPLEPFPDKRELPMYPLKKPVVNACNFVIVTVLIRLLVVLHDQLFSCYFILNVHKGKLMEIMFSTFALETLTSTQELKCTSLYWEMYRW